jgi:hypothetical protein
VFDLRTVERIADGDIARAISVLQGGR